MNCADREILLHNTSDKKHGTRGKAAMMVENKHVFRSTSESARRYLIVICLIVALVILSVFWGFHLRSENLYRQQLIDNGRSFFEEIVITRLWLAQHQGVYVKKTPDVEINPYLLAIPGLKVVIEDRFGDFYILKNPALVTREISRIADERGLFRFRITSLKPLNPDNRPDDFEKQALHAFSLGTREQYRFEAGNNGKIFRYMAPLIAEASCLQCHAQQGYSAGDVRGGISVTIPAQDTMNRIQANKIYLGVAVLCVILIIFLIVYFIARYFMKDLHLAEQKLMDMAATDPLTGLLNRREGFLRIAVEFSRAERTGEDICAMMLDIDHFKNINDTYGHLTGDEVLGWLASCLQATARISDVLCRFGGEEFLLATPDTDLENAKILAERIRLAVEKNTIQTTDGKTLKVTVSCGLALRQSGETSDELINRADQALYAAKNSGRNKVCVG
jgi:diguanylate cyclase (GGDEF)-like protein